MIYLGTNPVNVADLITTTDSINSSQAAMAITAPSGTPLLLTNNNITLLPTVWTNAEDSNYNCSLFTIPSNLFNSQKWEIINNNREKISLEMPSISSAEYYNILIQTFSSFMSNDYIGKIYVGTEFIGGLKSNILINSIENSNAIVAATIPSDVSITMVKNNISLEPIIWPTYENNNYNCSLFTVPSSLFDSENEWKLVDIDGDKINSNTILIPSSQYYSISLNTRILYSRGTNFNSADWSFRARSTAEEDYLIIKSDITTHPITGEAQGVDGVAGFKTPIDVTTYNTLHAIIAGESAKNTFYLGIGSTYIAGNFITRTYFTNIGTDEIEYTVDISEDIGEAYVKVQTGDNDYWTGVKIYKIWLD